MLTYHLATKPLSVRGSVAVKLYAVLTHPNQQKSRLQLIDQCMPRMVAEALYKTLRQGVDRTPGTALEVTGEFTVQEALANRD